MDINEIASDSWSGVCLKKEELVRRFVPPGSDDDFVKQNFQWQTVYGSGVDTLMVCGHPALEVHDPVMSAEKCDDGMVVRVTMDYRFL